MQTRGQKRQMDSMGAVGVDAYQSFNDEVFLNTVDNILSDEHTYNTSFDEYNFAGAGDGGGESQMQGLDGTRDEPTNERSMSNGTGHNGRARLSGKKSPYFASDRVTWSRAKQSAAAQREITQIDDQSESETEPELPESARAPTPPLPPAPEPVPEADAMSFDKEDHDGEMEIDTAPVPQSDGIRETEPQALPVDDDLPEEDRILAQLGPEQQVELIGFIQSHSFMREHGYPVGRCARRRFMGEVREKASVLGLDQYAIQELAKFIRRIYLETWAEGQGVNDDYNSEFGEEFDDENENSSKKERKRKRRSSEKSKDKHRKIKKDKRSGSDEDAVPQAEKPEVIDIEDSDVLPDNTPQENVNYDTPEVPESAEKTITNVQPDNHDVTVPTAPSTRNSPYKTRYSDLGLEADPIPLDDEVEDGLDPRSVKGIDAQKPVATHPVQPPTSPERNGTPHKKNNSSMDLGPRDHPISLDDDDNDNREDTGKPEVSKKASVDPKPPKSTKQKKDEATHHEDGHNVSEQGTNKFDLHDEAVAVIDPGLFEPTKKKARAERKKERGIHDHEDGASKTDDKEAALDRKRERNRLKRQRRRQRLRERKAQEKSEQQSATQPKKPEVDLKENAENINRPIPEYPEGESMDYSNILKDPHWDLDL